MPKYTVETSYFGYNSYEIEADSEDEAESEAMREAGRDFSPYSNVEITDIEEQYEEPEEEDNDPIWLTPAGPKWITQTVYPKTLPEVTG